MPAKERWPDDRGRCATVDPACPVKRQLGAGESDLALGESAEPSPIPELELVPCRRRQTNTFHPTGPSLGVYLAVVTHRFGPVSHPIPRIARSGGGGHPASTVAPLFAGLKQAAEIGS